MQINDGDGPVTFSLYSISLNHMLKITKMINFVMCISVNHTYIKRGKNKTAYFQRNHNKNGGTNYYRESCP